MLKVLFIDDDPIFLELLQTKVQSKSNVIVDVHTTYGILQEAINSSESALSALSDFDLIFLDCDFGNALLNGPLLLKQLRDVHEELSKRVILMTGKRDEFPSHGDVTILDKYKEIFESFPEMLYGLRKRRD